MRGNERDTDTRRTKKQEEDETEYGDGARYECQLFLLFTSSHKVIKRKRRKRKWKKKAETLSLTIYSLLTENHSYRMVVKE